MTAPGPRPSPRRAARCFAGSRGGSAGVEFAVLLPVMLALWAGASELSHAVDEWRKLTLFGRTVADLTAQGELQSTASNPIQVASMTDIFAAAPRVMRPFDTTNVSIRVSALGVDTKKSATRPVVCSSYANGKITALPTGLSTTLTTPAGFTDGMRYVLAEVAVTYQPMIGSAFIRQINGGKDIKLTASVPWPARGGKIYTPATYTEVILPMDKPKACDGTTDP